MSLKLIKNASVYRVKLPATPLLENHLNEIPFADLGPSDMNRAGFVPIPDISEGELVTPFIGGVAFAVRYDEKVIPGGVVLSETAKAVQAREQDTGLRVGRKERREIRDVVIADLCVRALIRTKVVTCFFHIETDTLIVPVASQSLADRIISLLLQAVGAIESRPIHIDSLKGGLTTRLAGFLANDDSTFAPFELSSSVWLEGPVGAKVTYQMQNDLETSRVGLNELLGEGFTVAAIRLDQGSSSFKLTNKFKFKAIDFGTPAEAQEFEHRREAWEHEAALQVLIFTDAVSKLCTLFGYKEPVAEEADKTEEAAEVAEAADEDFLS